MSEAAATATTATESAAGALGVAGTPPAPEAANATWYDGFNDDLKGYVEVKGWKDPSATVESYRNLEKLVGAPPDQILRLPKADADPSEWDQVWSRLGRPGDPKEYEFDLGPDADPRLTEWAQSTFHKLGLPKDKAATLMKEYAALESATLQAEQEAYTEQTRQDAAALKKEWGAAFEQNAQLAKAAAGKLGIDGPTIDKLERVLGFSGVMKLFQGIGGRTGEGDFITSGSGAPNTGVMTPSAAKARISALRADPGFVQRYTKNDASAMDEMRKLHEWAYPE